MSFVEPVVLAGRRWVTLEPLQAGHAAEIAAAASDTGDLWFTNVPTPDTAAAWVQTRLADPHGFTFVVRSLDGTVIGSTSYLNIDGPNRRLEIGATWYATTARRTGVNTEAKLLLLTHAFEVLDCVAVEFRTHFFNATSRAAIERLGAKLDGVLRSHQLLADGSRRDTVVYSILDIEWPAVRNNLAFRLVR
ncbi:GNAT family protein [Mycobacterium sp. ITM-2016-00316]|uniref:GNAT family N-acetyltransferase n=1 Tax=Mycobacterium sp. ITM-2016-00316 TaxID=2099695 RepID=UPI000CF97812|nr:GNAT family protein [Mycobacterium sp. ITM-2016-00316]WNG81166.1 GNAT family protein [Mycobacterium sp. ITM-2016-00316]